jgi:hypothetical protein
MNALELFFSMAITNLATDPGDGMHMLHLHGIHVIFF